MCQTFYVRAISPLNGTDPVSPAHGRWLPSLVYVYVAILIVKLIVTCSAAEAVYLERRDDQLAPDPARCFDCPVDPAPAAQ